MLANRDTEDIRRAKAFGIPKIRIRLGIILSFSETVGSFLPTANQIQDHVIVALHFLWEIPLPLYSSFQVFDGFTDS